MAQKGQTQISLPKHKTVSQNTNQFPKTQISLPKHKSISQNTNQFRETQIKRLGTCSVIIREPGRDSFPGFSASNMATSNMLSGRSKMFCHNCGSKELQECFFALNVEQSLKLLFHLFDNCCLPEIKRKRRQKRLACFNSGFSYNYSYYSLLS